MRYTLLIFFMIAGTSFVSAQTWEMGVFAGASGYMGDINPVRPDKFTDPAYGAQFKRNFNAHWSAKLNFVQGKVRADDKESSNVFQRQRNLNFYSPLTEFSLQVEFNLFKYMPGEVMGYGGRKISPFIFTGVSSFSFNPKTNLAGEEVELIPVQTEAIPYKGNAFSIPYGAGVKYNIKGNLSLIAEIGYRTAFTDYLDDISGVYPDYTAIRPASTYTIALTDRSVMPKIGLPGVQRGDFRPRDTYMFTGISLTYTFVPIKCPTF